MKILFLCIGLFLSLFANTLFALEVGDSAPKLSLSKVLRGKAIKLPSSNSNNTSGDTENICVVYFWATWMNSAIHLLDFVERENTLYSDDKVLFIGITKERQSLVENFLNKLPELDINLAVDDKAKTYNKYMEGTDGVPLFFVIDQKGKLLYKGSPMELDRVLSRIIPKSFDMDKQKKIETIRNEVRKASLIMDEAKMERSAKEILEIDQTDETSLSILTDKYVREGKYTEAIEMVQKARKEAFSNKYIHRSLYLIEFGIIRRMQKPNNKKEYLEKFVNNYYLAFQNSPRDLNEIVQIILRDIPFEIRPTKDLIKLAERSVSIEMQNRSKDNRLGIFLATLAQVYYFANLTDQAIKAQKESVLLMSDTQRKSDLFLPYYENLDSVRANYTRK